VLVQLRAVDLIEVSYDLIVNMLDGPGRARQAEPHDYKGAKQWSLGPAASFDAEDGVLAFSPFNVHL
jgi:hypothetical protein